MLCESCGEECWRDEVDVGVGVIYGPYGCFCGWSEDSYYDRSKGVSPAQLEHPDHYVDSRGGLTPHAGIQEMFRQPSGNLEQGGPGANPDR